MFAFLAIVAFILYAVDRTILEFNMLGIGLVFLTLAVAVGNYPFDNFPGRRKRE